MNKEIEIVGLGEALMDIYQDGTATLGGAPLNVAVHANRLLSAAGHGRGLVVSAIGADTWGEAVRSSLRSNGMCETYLTINGRPTGTAQVWECGKDVKCEIQPSVAWDQLVSSRDMILLARRCNAVAFGSLAQRSPRSRQTIHDFVREVKGIRFYDVNLRRNAVSGALGYTRSIIETSCYLADFLKANTQELLDVADILGFRHARSGDIDHLICLMHRIRERYALRGVLVTRDKDASVYVDGNSHIITQSEPGQLDEIHPVGAGDAFVAGMLFGLTMGWDISHCLHLAEKMGRWIVQQVSATAPLPPEILSLAVAPLEEHIAAIEPLKKS